jgi:hypothetical protein
MLVQRLGSHGARRWRMWRPGSIPLRPQHISQFHLVCRCKGSWGLVPGHIESWKSSESRDVWMRTWYMGFTSTVFHFIERHSGFCINYLRIDKLKIYTCLCWVIYILLGIIRKLSEYKKQITSYTYSDVVIRCKIKYPAMRVEIEIRSAIREGKGQVCTCIKGKKGACWGIPSSQPLLVRYTGIATCSWPIVIRTIDRDLKMQ